MEYFLFFTWFALMLFVVLKIWMANKALQNSLKKR